MADTENPFAKYAQPPAEAAGAENPFAKYKQPEVGAVEDAVKGGVSGLGQGVLAIPGTLGDLEKIGEAVRKKVSEHLPEAPGIVQKAFDWIKNAHGTPFANGHLPSTSDIQKDVEGVTGPFYEAQTPVGKGLQTAGQIAPALALGGESIPAVAAKALGGGALSEGAGEAANAIKGYLPQSFQPYAEPVARAAGAMGGTFTPAGARRVITPNPMTDERLATVNALRGSNPELVNASTAGQLTESPRLMGLEARSPRMEDVGQRKL